MVMLMCSHDRKVRSLAKNVFGSMRIIGAVTILAAPSRGPSHFCHHGWPRSAPAAAAPKPVDGRGGEGRPRKDVLRARQSQRSHGCALHSPL
jgi:hypothetical protein